MTHRTGTWTLLCLLATALGLACSEQAEQPRSVSDAGVVDAAPQHPEVHDAAADPFPCANPTTDVVVGDFIDPIPSLEGCTEIGGDLLILSPDREDLVGLESLSVIRGDLIVVGNTKLRSLKGLDGLTRVDGNVVIGGTRYFSDGPHTGNPELREIGSLDELTSIGGDLVISDNGALWELNGLRRLAEVGRDVNVSDNGLGFLHGLDALSLIGGSLSIGSNKLLMNLRDLSQLSEIRAVPTESGEDAYPPWSGLWIDGNDRLVSLDGLEGLRSIAGSVFVTANMTLSDLDGLKNLAHVSSELRVSRNERLQNVDGLSHLTTVGALGIVSSPNLKNLDGLASLTGTISGTVTITFNPQLRDIDGLRGIQRIEGDAPWADYERESGLVVTDNSLLASIAGTDSLVAVHGPLVIGNNVELSECAVAALAQRLGKLTNEDCQCVGNKMDACGTQGGAQP